MVDILRLAARHKGDKDWLENVIQIEWKKPSGIRQFAVSLTSANALVIWSNVSMMSAAEKKHLLKSIFIRLRSTVAGTGCRTICYFSIFIYFSFFCTQYLQHQFIQIFVKLAILMPFPTFFFHVKHFPFA